MIINFYFVNCARTPYNCITFIICFIFSFDETNRENKEKFREKRNGCVGQRNLYRYSKQKHYFPCTFIWITSERKIKIEKW